MTTLYLDRRELSLKQEGRSLVIFENGSRRGSVPLHLLERVVLRSSVNLDSALLAHLAEAGVGVLVFGGRYGAKRALVLGDWHNDAARRIGQYRAYGDDEWRRVWSQRLVTLKVKGQARLLQRALRERPDLRLPLTTAVDRLDGIRTTLSREEASVERVRGLEGAAAAAYFEGLCPLFPEALAFKGRNRRPPRDPVNAVLSLGYTLLHAEAVLACHAVGLDPLIGFYHELAFGRESLASDLIEALRPRVDAWAWERFRARDLRAEDFETNAGACLLGKPGRRTFYATWELFARGPRRLLRRYAGRLAQRLAERAGEVGDASAAGAPRAPLDIGHHAGRNLP